MIRNELDRMKDILDAIKSVKKRAQDSLNKGDQEEYAKLMFDLMALENCLVTECELLLNNESKVA